ncbi:Myb-like protein J [Phytophthora citrophthora]|uniref:Myb-like protein J n=1 Tax=Phytophthora citrophthora TaxID=4793 RepID=A0AAD9G594_9STRA|nr:Myb-like protein J [Phytophthora citrophthora]
MYIFGCKKAISKWIKGIPDATDILEALEVTRPCLSTEDPVWTPEEHEVFVQELKNYPMGDYELIAETIGTKSTAQVTSYGIKCWESDEYQQVVAKRQQRRAKRPKHQVRKWLRAVLKWCGEAFSFRYRRSRYHDETQAGEISDTENRYAPGIFDTENRYAPEIFDTENRYAPGIFDTELLRPRSIAGPVPRGSVYITPEEKDEDDLDMRLAHLAAEQIEWYESGGSKSTPKIRSIEKKTGPWTKEEHERYCEALELYRYGSWKLIADYIKTRTDRQVMSHAQSIRAKRKRAEKREKQQNMANGVPTKVSKTTEGGRVDRKAQMLTSTIDTSQEGRHSLEVAEEIGKECTTRPLSSTKLSNSPLCSPPPDILVGSFLNDEDLFELIDTPSPIGETFTL